MIELQIPACLLCPIIDQAEKNPSGYPAITTYLSELRRLSQQASHSDLDVSVALSVPTFDDYEKLRIECGVAVLREVVSVVQGKATELHRRKEAGQLTDADKAYAFTELRPILDSAKDCCKSIKSIVEKHLPPNQQ